MPDAIQSTGDRALNKRHKSSIFLVSPCLHETYILVVTGGLTEEPEKVRDWGSTLQAEARASAKDLRQERGYNVQTARSPIRREWAGEESGRR